MPLGEMARHELPSLREEEGRRPDVDDEGERPTGWSGTLRRSRTQPRGGRCRAPCSYRAPSRSAGGRGRRGSRSRTARCARRARRHTRRRRRARRHRMHSERSALLRGMRPSPRRSRAGRHLPRGRRRSSTTHTRPTPTRARRGRVAPRTSPCQVGSAAISAVHWVSASTKTRSKKSSSVVTRSPSRRTAFTRDGRDERLHASDPRTRESPPATCPICSRGCGRDSGRLGVVAYPFVESPNKTRATRASDRGRRDAHDGDRGAR